MRRWADEDDLVGLFVGEFGDGVFEDVVSGGDAAVRSTEDDDVFA